MEDPLPMKVITNTILLLNFIFSIFFISCLNRTIQDKKNDFKLQENFEYVHLIPDSLRTSGQKELCELILKTIVQNLVVVNNHLDLKISENEFLNLGIQKPYYDLLMHDLDNINYYIDSTGIDNVDSILKESYKGLYLKFESIDHVE